MEECYRCSEMVIESGSFEGVQEDHERCHGYMHCGDECCGACYICGE